MPESRARPYLRFVVAGVGVALIGASLLPLAETNVWWVRWLDFPRLQFLVGLAAALVAYLFLRPRGYGEWAIVVLLTASVGYQIYKLYPYLPWTPAMAVAAADCPADSRFGALVANVRMGNRQAAELIRMVEEVEPDLFVALETDAWWDERLSALGDAYPHRVQHIGGDYYGIHLFSRYELLAPEVRFLVAADVPAIFAGVRLPSGEAVSLYALHPRPPHPFQDSTGRDAQILATALVARDDPRPAVLAGDLNGTPWERTIRRAMRIGGFLDPRVGRGLYSTYDAQQPLMRWPLDQILHQDEMAPMRVERLPGFGSDHFPFLVELCHAPALADRQSAPAMEDGDLQEAETTIEAALAAKRAGS